MVGLFRVYGSVLWKKFVNGILLTLLTVKIKLSTPIMPKSRSIELQTWSSLPGQGTECQRQHIDGGTCARKQNVGIEKVRFRAGCF